MKKLGKKKLAVLIAAVLLVILLIISVSACSRSTPATGDPESSTSSLSPESGETGEEAIDLPETGTSSGFEKSSEEEESTSKSAPTPEPEEGKSGTSSAFEESSADPKPTIPPKTTATPKPTNSKEEKETAKPTATPKPTAAPKPTEAPKATATPAPVTEQVWVVDVPGHYETVTETKEVWVEEQGHWDYILVSSVPVYRCNGCKTVYNSEDEVANHNVEEAINGNFTCGSYTYMGDDATYNKIWVVDVPGHYETQTVETQVWVEEQGHWETVTNE